ncbi:MAG TPA: VCBS repeat-containing protein [Verrucomicrobiae bacterium]|nr:VCBS repeat-containing protein [Verrucomicrobiae bacterium]
MKTLKPLIALVLSTLVGWGLAAPFGACQSQSPAPDDELVKIAPQSILDSCKEAERKFRIYLARFSPKELRDTAVWRGNALRAGSFWMGDLGPDSAEYAIIHYRCFESGYLAVLKKNQKQEHKLLWQSPDFGIGVKFGRLGEPQDINKDGNKEIFFYHPERNAMDTTLELYGWDGKTAQVIGRVTGNSIVITDLNGDGMKEIIANHKRYVWSQAVDTLVTYSEFYRWDGKAYKHYDTKKTTTPVKD